MANTNVTIPARKLMREVRMQITVTGLRMSLFRFRCAAPLLWLAAKIAGCQIEIVHAKERA